MPFGIIAESRSSCPGFPSTETIPLFGNFGLADQIGTTDYTRPRRYRAMIEQWLDSIRVLCPECPARISSDGQAMIVRHASAVLPAEATASRVLTSSATVRWANASSAWELAQIVPEAIFYIARFVEASRI